MFAALNDSALTRWLNDWSWGFPCAEVFHIVMTGGFFGAVVLMDLRLLGVHRWLSVTALLQHAVPVLRWLFAGVVVSGGVLFLFMPLEYSHNPAFFAKLVFIAIGGLNAACMHAVLLRQQASWDSGVPVPLAVKCAASLSLLLWMGALASGRLIAYFYGVHGE